MATIQHTSAWFVFVNVFSWDIFNVNQERGLELVRVLLEQALFADVIVLFIWRSPLSWTGVIISLFLWHTQLNMWTWADNDLLSKNISGKLDIEAALVPH